MAQALGNPISDIEINMVASNTGQTAWLDTSNVGNFHVILAVSQRSGTTPTLDWTVEESYDGTDNGGTATNIGGTFTQITSGTTLPNIQTKLFAPGGDVTKWARYVRVKWALSGTAPQFTKTIAIRSLTYKA